MEKMYIGIIGTAGRRSDGKRISKELYLKMYKKALELLSDIPVEKRHLVSGAAAVSDHLAVSLYLADEAASLTLHLPAEFEDGQFVERDVQYDPGKTSNYYHHLFGLKMSPEDPLSTLKGVEKAIEKGAETSVSKGFKARNLLVGQVERLLAFTFGEGDIPKDGGTKHTWDRSKADTKIHIPLGALGQ